MTVIGHHPRVVLIDLDGTVRDTAAHVHLVTQKPKRYDEFAAAVLTCPPIPRIARVIQERYLDRPDWLAIVATGQKERDRAGTEEWIKRNLGHVFWTLMRQNEDHRPAADTKRDMVRRLRSWGYQVVEAWDDDPDVIEMYHDEGLDAHWVFNQTRAS